jgi:hypothetical protein
MTPLILRPDPRSPMVLRLWWVANAVGLSDRAALPPSVGFHVALPDLLNDGRSGRPAATASRCSAIQRSAVALVANPVIVVGAVPGTDTSTAKASPVCERR